MKLRNMNANEEERAKLLAKIKGLLADNKELLRLMKQHIDTSDDANQDFERLYNSMIASDDYSTRKPNNERKIPKLQRMRGENEKFKRLRDDGVAVCNKYSDDYLEDCYDIDEMNDIVKELTTLNGDLKGYVKILEGFVKVFEKRRLKTKDAEVRKNAAKHKKTHDEVEATYKKCMSAINSIEGAVSSASPKAKSD